MIKFVTLTLLSLLTINTLSSQSLNDYRSNGNVNFTSPANWQRYNGSGWVSATEVPVYTNANMTTISHSATVDANITVDQFVLKSGANVTVNNGITLSVRPGTGTDFNSESGSNFTNNGTVVVLENGWIDVRGVFTNNSTMNVTGVFRLSDGGSINSNGTLTFLSTGRYVLDHRTNNFVPRATWNDGSTLVINRFDFKSQINNIDQNFYNVTFDVNQNPQNFNLEGKLTTVRGNLEIIGSGQNPKRIVLTKQNQYTLNIGGDLILNNNSDLYVTEEDVINSPFTVNIGGSFINNSGNFNFIGSARTINGSSDMSVNIGNKFILKDGDVIFSNRFKTIIRIGGDFEYTGGSISFNNSGSNSELIFNKNGIQSFTSVNTFSGLYNLQVINNSTLNLNSNIATSGTLTMNCNLINTNTNKVILNNESASSLIYTAGYINGKFSRNISKTAMSNYQFPLGTSDGKNKGVLINYITSPSTTGNLTVYYISGDPGTPGSTLDDAGYLLDTYSKEGYWQVDNIGVTGGLYNMGITAQGIVGSNTPSMLRIIRRDNSTSPWTLAGTHQAGTGSASNPTAKRNSLLNFSQFAIAGNSANNPLDGALPVELSAFTSNINGRNVILNWSTAMEENNKGFEIYRSQNNSNEWTNIGFVNGNGTKNGISNYSYEDKKLETGKYQYKLKQIDYNGNYEYFELTGDVEVGTPSKFNMSQNYPNPFNPVTKIDFQLSETGSVSLKIYDLTGREIQTLVNGNYNAGYHTVQFDGKNLSSGIYFYKIIVKFQNGISYSDLKKMSLVK